MSLARILVVGRVVGRLARVLPVLVALLVLGGSLATRALGAQVDRALLELGDGLARMVPSQPGARELWINGQSLHLEHQIDDRPLDTIVDEAERGCTGGEGETEPLFWEARGERRAYGICLGPGLFRYLYVESLGRSGDEGRRRLELRAGQGFRPGELFPERGDAPGWDVADLPRPPGSRRWLCAGELGAGYGLRLYLGSEHRREDLVRWYLRELPRREWQVIGSEEQEEGELIIARKGERMVFLLVNEGAGDRAQLLLADTVERGEAAWPL